MDAQASRHRRPTRQRAPKRSGGALTPTNNTDEHALESGDRDDRLRHPRLAELLAARSHFSTRAGWQRSHRLEQAQDAFSLQLLLETMIRDEFPEDYDRMSEHWVVA